MARRHETPQTIERAKQVYSYDPNVGTFLRTEQPRGGAKPGKLGTAGAVTTNGYMLISVSSVHYLAHRLAWAWVYGEWPKGYVEHINGNLLDNRIENLRLKLNGANELTLVRLKEVLDYDPATGKFVWKIRTTRSAEGQEAGTFMKGLGYVTISVDGKRFLAHRLAWFHVHGEWPEKYIDHINGVRDDNRIENLREATPSDNSHNQKLRSTNTTGFRGVSRYQDGRFLVRISRNNRLIDVGKFETFEEARAARIAAEAMLGLFAREEN